MFNCNFPEVSIKVVIGKNPHDSIFGGSDYSKGVSNNFSIDLLTKKSFQTRLCSLSTAELGKKLSQLNYIFNYNVKSIVSKVFFDVTVFILSLFFRRSHSRFGATHITPATPEHKKILLHFRSG